LFNIFRLQRIHAVRETKKGPASSGREIAKPETKKNAGAGLPNRQEQPFSGNNLFLTGCC
jgi:hypothetical protein